jgi:hypothetical protein
MGVDDQELVEEKTEANDVTRQHPCRPCQPYESLLPIAACPLPTTFLRISNFIIILHISDAFLSFKPHGSSPTQHQRVEPQ